MAARRRTRRKPPKHPFWRTPVGMVLELIGFGAIVAAKGVWRAFAGAERRAPRAAALGVIGLVALVVIIVAYRGATVKNGHEVLMDGERVGVVKIVKGDAVGEAFGEYIAEMAVKRLSAAAGSAVRVNEAVTARDIHAKPKDFAPMDTVLADVEARYTYAVAACEITVDGKRMAVVDSVETADGILDKLKQAYYQEGLNITKAEFVEDVSVSPIFVQKGELTSRDSAAAILTANAQAGQTYVIQSGDSLGKIAGNADMTLTELLGVNPGYTVDTKLKIGEVLNIVIAKPLLSVRTYERVTYTEVVPKPVETRYVDTQKKSWSRVVQQGKDGSRTVTADIIRVNGLETDRAVITEQVGTEPITEIVEVGTK